MGFVVDHQDCETGLGWRADVVFEVLGPGLVPTRWRLVVICQTGGKGLE